MHGNLDEALRQRLERHEVRTLLLGRDGASLHKDVVQAADADNAAGGCLFNQLKLTAHQQEQMLNGCLDAVDLTLVHVPWAHDINLLANRQAAAEDACNGDEPLPLR